jgi:hypothetical protein
MVVYLCMQNGTKQHYMMKATIITTEDLRNCDGRDYNPQVWETNINRMVTNYNDVVFYHVPKGEDYDYDRYYVEYTLPDGLRLFSDFGYGSSLTSGGFYRLDKNEVTADGLTHSDLMEKLKSGSIDEANAILEELELTTTYQIELGKFFDEATGNMVGIGTSKEARAWMTERSVKYGLTFTKGL